MTDENINAASAKQENFDKQANTSGSASVQQNVGQQNLANNNSANAAAASNPTQDLPAGQTTLKVNIGDPDSPEQIEIRTPNFGRQHVLHVLVLFGLLFMAFTFVFQVYLTPVYVVGTSMSPTLNLQSTGPTDKTHTDLIYTKPVSHYKNGDIIVTDNNAYPGQTDSIVKRVIATEGQTLTFKLLGQVNYYPNTPIGYDYYTFKYTIWLNGQILDEPYLKDVDQELRYNRLTDYSTIAGYNKYAEFCNAIASSQTGNEYSITISPGCVFVMGDNRNVSIDSRRFGQIETKHIKGKVVLHIPYGTNFFVGLWNAIFKRNSAVTQVRYAN